ncbi:hypothetical protein EV702DRAFT_1044534 [Suillus placidus]|uniref:Uncharacterized protein n=1 Tax=Suillus placidus TaxID=48579 RepID=A0A9P6ZXS6_9AGAM|nr:hypothetical protein EV702DRAFT_1044534 [Suillus placidus]
MDLVRWNHNTCGKDHSFSDSKFCPFILCAEIVGHFTVEESDPMETTLYFRGSGVLQNHSAEAIASKPRTGEQPLEAREEIAVRRRQVGMACIIFFYFGHKARKKSAGRVRRNDQFIMAGRCAVNKYRERCRNNTTRLVAANSSVPSLLVAFITGSQTGICHEESINQCATKPHQAHEFCPHEFCKKTETTLERRSLSVLVGDEQEILSDEGQSVLVGDHISPLKPVRSENLSLCGKNQPTSGGSRGMLLESHPSIFEGEVREWTNDDESVEQQSRHRGKLSTPVFPHHNRRQTRVKTVISTVLMMHKKWLQSTSTIHVPGLDNITASESNLWASERL